MERPTKDASISFRLNADERAALERAAKADQRTMSAFARKVLVGWLKRNGWMKAREAMATTDDDPFPRPELSPTRALEMMMGRNPDAAIHDRLSVYSWVCATCTDTGWIDQRAGGDTASGWAVCPDCGNPHGGSQP